jgi:hypothetical protein
MMQGIAALVAAGATVATAYFASRALSAWRGEVIGRRKVELAEDILAAAHEADEVVKGARSPMAYNGEGASLNLGPEIEEGQRRNAEAMYAVAERLNAKLDLWAKIEALRYRARAYFGEPVWGALSEILRIRAQVHGASVALARNALRAAPQRISQQLQERYEALIWYADDPDEPLQVRVDAAINSLKQSCGPTITEKAPSTENPAARALFR